MSSVGTAVRVKRPTAMQQDYERVLEALERVAAQRRARIASGTTAGLRVGARAAERRDTADLVRRAIARHRGQARSTAAR